MEEQELQLKNAQEIIEANKKEQLKCAIEIVENAKKQINEMGFVLSVSTQSLGNNFKFSIVLIDK